MKMKIVILLVITSIACLLASCKSVQHSGNNAWERTSMSYGGQHYVFLQNKEDVSCRYNLMVDKELMTYLETNHVGDRDDRIPRQIMTTTDDLISIRKSETHPLRVSTKVCMDPSGKVVAFRMDAEDASTPLDDAILALGFEERNEAKCVECRTVGVWAKG